MFLLLFFLGHTVTAVPLPGVHNETGLNLDCTNDCDNEMFCQLEAQNCIDYNLTIQSDAGYGAVSCILQQCDTGRCCCTLNVTLIPEETHTATVQRDGKNLESKKISVSDTVKPRTPTIISVSESEGNFEVKWRSNMHGTLGDTLTTEVTFYKKGDTEKVSELINSAFVDGLNFYSINGQQLEPSTTYLVSLRTRTNISGKFSNSSKEWEFTTSPSPAPVLLGLLIGLSITAIVITGVIYGSYVKCKTEWWDTVKDINPELLNIHPGKQKLLKPSAPIISPVSVSIRDDCNSLDDSNKGLKQLLIDTSGSLQQSSGISIGSSELSYANTEPVQFSINAVQEALRRVLPGITQMPFLTANPFTEFNSNDCVKVHDTSSGSSGFDNKTYSLLIPRDTTYHPSESNTVTCPIQQVPNDLSFLQKDGDSSLMVIEDSYQQYNAESGRFSYAEDSSLSSISSDINTADRDLVSSTEAGCKASEEVDSDGPNLNVKMEEAKLCDKYPSHGSLVVDNDYQSFQSLVRQPDVSFSEEKRGEQGEHLDKYQDESLKKIPQSVLGPVITPSVFLSAESSAPLPVVSDYHCV